MSATVYTVTIDEMLASRLKEHAAAIKRPAEEIIAACVSHHLDTAVKFLFLIERMNLVDQSLIDLASFVGEVAAEMAPQSTDDYS